MNFEISPLTCSSEELYTVVSSRNRTWLMLSLSNSAIQEDHLIALLRNPSITPEIVYSISERNVSYKIQYAIASCPKTPYPLGISVIQNLFWNDLLKVVANFRLNPRLRRIAENYLYEKAANLTLGEKMSLARTAPRPLIPLLRGESEPKVIRELLRNPNLVEDDVLAMINHQLTPSVVLATIGRDYKWKVRYPIRLALVRNDRTPLAVTLGFLSSLRKTDLKAVASALKTPDLIRCAADRILSGKY